MIGSALKKLAKENGMKVDKGVAYGAFRGYCATFSEGAGYKQMVLATRFPDQSKQDELIGFVSRMDVNKEFRVQDIRFAYNGISVVFLDNPGTMARIHAFVDWFFPLLERLGATGMDICPECGAPVENGCWILRNGVAAFYVHASCAENCRQAMENEKEEKKQTDNGSYVRGAVGALLGALIGSAVWAVVLYLGYVASIVGLLIGWLANKGYELLKGKQGKGKLAILVIAIILGVLVGTILPDVVYLAQSVGAGELDITYGQIPELIATVFMMDAEYRGGVLGNCGMGLLFAALGAFALLRKTGKEVAEDKLVYLEQ